MLPRNSLLRVLFIYAVAVFSALPAILAMVVALITQPRKFLRRKKRTSPPANVTDPNYTHVFKNANGLQFHTVTYGKRDATPDPKRRKKLMLCLHGFPEFWYSWRFQMKEFHRDYHVVAVDMRGYGDSDKPAGRAQYTQAILSRDVVGLIAALGYDSCILMAHDWGGIVAWDVAYRYPQVLDRLIIFNSPNPRCFVRQSGWSQFRKSWYIFFFHLPWLPELMMCADDYKPIGSSFKGRKIGLVRRRDEFSSQDVEAYKYAFSRPGAATAAINYYRNIFYTDRLPKGKCQVKTLVLWGLEDNALEFKLNDGIKSEVADVTLVPIEKCSHWSPIDAPEEANEHIRKWLSTH